MLEAKSFVNLLLITQISRLIFFLVMLKVEGSFFNVLREEKCRIYGIGAVIGL